MKKYNYLLFDIDGTLLDFYKSEAESIRAVFAQHGLPNDDATVKRYSEINDVYWKRFEKGEIKREEIFVGRFVTFLQETHLSANAEQLSTDYVKKLSNSAILMQGAIELLKNLKEKYILCAATNGLTTTQYSRLRLSGLDRWFDHIFISGEMGTKKPDLLFFEKIFKALNCSNPSEYLMIGDSLRSDILGGNNAGCDTCLVNTLKKPLSGEIVPTFTVERLESIISTCKL